jgi:hypothetical protein
VRSINAVQVVALRVGIGEGEVGKTLTQLDENDSTRECAHPEEEYQD